MTVTLGQRELLGALGGAAVGWPLAARAQQPAKAPRIGMLYPGPHDAARVAICATLLSRLGEPNCE